MEHDRGFHGWLVFFFVTACLGVLVRAYVIFQAAQLLWLVAGQGNGVVIASSIGRLLVHVGLLLATLRGLWFFLNEDSRTPTFWAILFLASILGALVTYSLIALQATHYQDTTFGAGLWQSLRDGGLRGMGVYLAWALYWMFSKRVRLTYGRNAFEPGANRDAAISPQVT
jgi:hypothetical protein